MIEEWGRLTDELAGNEEPVPPIEDSKEIGRPMLFWGEDRPQCRSDELPY